MESIIIAILVILGVIVVSALLFGGWLIYAIVRLVARGIGALVSRPSARGMPQPHLVRCSHAICRAENPKSARFCRRCGKMLHAAPERHVARTAAMW